MAISVVLNGVTYTIPQTGEEGWGSNVTDYLSAIPSGVLQKTGGAFTLSANVNFGPTYGLLSKYLSTRTASPSSVGLVRLAVSDSIGWRNNADDGNLLLSVNASDRLLFNGSIITPIDVSGNFSANNFLAGYTTTATAAATTTLTVASTELQFFTGVTTQTVLLPVTSTLVLGLQFTVVNKSSGIVTVQSSGANTIQAIAANTQATFTCILTSGTTAASWNVSNSLPTLVPIANGGTGVSSVTTAPTASAWAGWDANSNLSANNVIAGYATTATAASTTTLTVTSARQQFFTGATTQTVVLPVATTLVTGLSFLIVNNSTGIVTVNSSGGNVVQTLAPSSQVTVTCILASGTGSASWSVVYSLKALSNINYIFSNPNAEISTDGWVTYADAAGNIPVNGIGGSPNITWTRTTSSPLRGSASFLYTRTAANRQGEGVAFDFTIDAADCAKPLAINFDYVIASGTFFAADGITPPLNDGTTSQNAGMSDLEVFIYDVTNSALIPVSPQVLTSSSAIPETFKGIFQTNSTSTSYRLIIHTARSTAVAETVKFDNFFVGPQSVAYGSAITDWTSYTPTGTWSANTTYTGFYRRVGSNMEVSIKVATAGAPTTASLAVSLPAGFSVNTTVLADTTNGYPPLGTLVVNDSSTTGYSGTITYDSSANALRCLVPTTSADALSAVNQATPITFGSGDSVVISACIPISGWSSTTLMSNDTNTQVTAAYGNAQTPTGTINGSYNVVIFGTLTKDTSAAYNSSTGVYTVPVSGWYECSANVEVNVTITINQYVSLGVFQNGSAASYGGTLAGGSQASLTAIVSKILYAVAGDTLDFRIKTNGTGPTYASLAASQSAFSINRVTGPASIAATESVNVRATNTAGTSLPDGTQVPWGTITFDSHNEMNVNGTYTIPTSGKYSVNATIQYNSFNLTTAQVCFLTIKKTGVVSSTGPTQYGTGAGANLSAHVEDTLACVAGDTITIVANSQATGTLATTATVNHIAITRVGN